MNEGFQLIEIIILALVAGFLVFRLKSTLGRRTGYDEKAETDRSRWETIEDDNVIELPGRQPNPDEEIGGALGAGLADIRQLDPQFAIDPFLNGAKSAFEMILMAFAKGDLDTLRNLLSEEVFENFKAAIDQRVENGETMETEMMGFKRVQAEDAGTNGTIAQITVRFVTEQVNVIRDKDDKVVDGDPDHIAVITDLWTFARDMQSDDLTWQLVATDTED